VPDDCVHDVVGEVLVCEPRWRLVYTFGGNDSSS
jgi:hypothetical protein